MLHSRWQLALFGAILVPNLKMTPILPCFSDFMIPFPTVYLKIDPSVLSSKNYTPSFREVKRVGFVGLSGLRLVILYPPPPRRRRELNRNLELRTSPCGSEKSATPEAARRLRGWN